MNGAPAYLLRRCAFVLDLLKDCRGEVGEVGREVHCKVSQAELLAG